MQKLRFVTRRQVRTECTDGTAAGAGDRIQLAAGGNHTKIT